MNNQKYDSTGFEYPEWFTQGMHVTVVSRRPNNNIDHHYYCGVDYQYWIGRVEKDAQDNLIVVDASGICPALQDLKRYNKDMLFAETAGPCYWLNIKPVEHFFEMYQSDAWLEEDNHVFHADKNVVIDVLLSLYRNKKEI